MRAAKMAAWERRRLAGEFEIEKFFAGGTSDRSNCRRDAGAPGLMQLPKATQVFVCSFIFMVLRLVWLLDFDGFFQTNVR